MSVNIQAMIELEKKKKEALLEMKMREKLKRQIYIFNKEKTIFTRKMQHEINKQKRSLELLDSEKMTELENYLSVRSRTTEQLYKRQEAVVRDLVKSTDVVRELLYNDRVDTTNLNTKIDELTKETWDVKKSTTHILNEHNKYRVPNPFKMDNRVEHASRQYHEQLVKNREIEKAIDDAVILRELYMKEEKKLKKDVDMVTTVIEEILVETSDIYENRDRAEATKIKVKDHLNKVKDRYERELLSISLQLSEDKKMEAFMRTKHKDTTQYLRDMRDKEIRQVDQMMRTKDEYTKAFDEIMSQTGKKDINIIVHDFIEAEEGNFAIFQNIGELLDSNQAMRNEIANIRDLCVEMEDDQLVVDQATTDLITSAESRVKDNLWKSKRCQQRIKENNIQLKKFCDIIKPLVEFLKMDKSALPDCFNEKGDIKFDQLIEVMTYLEKTISVILQDFYMVELATRSQKTYDPDTTEDENMLCRVPSARILPHEMPKLMSIGLLKEKEDMHDMSQTCAMETLDMKNVVVKTLLETSTFTNGSLTKDKDAIASHTHVTSASKTHHK